MSKANCVMLQIVSFYCDIYKLLNISALFTGLTAQKHEMKVHR